MRSLLSRWLMAAGKAALVKNQCSMGCFKLRIGAPMFQLMFWHCACCHVDNTWVRPPALNPSYSGRSTRHPCLIRLPKEDNENEPADNRARDDEDDENRRLVGHEDYVLVSVRIPVASSKPHYVNAVTRGEVQSGLFAVGGETTGVNIAISPKSERMWELQLSPKDMDLIEMAEDKAIIVSGVVTLRKGIAIPYRWIMQVRSVLLK